MVAIWILNDQLSGAAERLVPCLQRLGKMEDCETVMRNLLHLTVSRSFISPETLIPRGGGMSAARSSDGKLLDRTCRTPLSTASTADDRRQEFCCALDAWYLLSFYLPSFFLICDVGESISVLHPFSVATRHECPVPMRQVQRWAAGHPPCLG
jgi:hypothetical protein